MATATLDDVLAASEHAAEALDKIVALLGKKPGDSGGGSGGGKSSGGKSSGSAIGGLLAQAGQVAQAATFVTGALMGVAKQAFGFVQALNPSLANLFSLELDNLSATIGEALTPIIANAVPIIKQFAGVMLELATELKPMIDDLSSAIGALFIAAVRNAAVYLKLMFIVLGPLIKALSWLGQIVAQLSEVQAALYQAIVDVGMELLSMLIPFDDVKEGFKELEQWLYRLARVVATAAGQLLVLVGATSILDKFKANLAKTIADKVNPKGGLLKAPDSASTSGIDDIAKKFAEKAFVASAAGAPKKPEVELLESILKGLEDSTTKDFKTIIIEALSEFLPKIGGATATQARDTVNSVLDPSATTFDRFAQGRESGGILGGFHAAIGGIGADIGRAHYELLR